MDLNLKIFINKVGPSTMIGRPAIFSREAFNIVKNDPFFTFGAEDADLSRQMEIAGMPQGHGTGTVYRKNLETMGECYRQWRRYGEGDGRFVCKHPSRILSVLFHLAIYYPIIKSVRVARLGFWRYSGFFVMQGLVRLIWASKEYVSLKVRGAPDTN